MLLAWLVQGSFAAPLGCAEAVDASKLDALLGRAESAISALEPEGLAASVVEATDALRCLGAPVEPEVLARFWRARGIQAFAEHDDGRAGAAFAAARALEPDLALDPVLQGPIAELFAASRREDTTARLPPPPTGLLFVDARPGLAVPVRRSALVQWVDEGHSVRQAWLLSPGDPLPTWAIIPPVPSPTPPSPPPSRARSSRGLLVAGLATGLAGGLAAGGAALAESAYLNSEQPPEEIAGTLGVNRALSFTSYGLFATAGGLGAAAVIVGRW